MQVRFGRDPEGLFGRTEGLAGGEDREFVALVAVGVEGEAPALLVAEIAQPAEVHRRVAAALQVLLAGFRPVRRRPVRAERLGLDVGVDIAELAAEADLQPVVAPGEMLLGVAPDALLRAPLDGVRDARAAAIGIEDPGSSACHTCLA